MTEVIRYRGADYEEKQRGVRKLKARALLSHSKQTTFGGSHMCKVVSAELEYLRRGILAYVEIKPTWVDGEVFEDEIDQLGMRLEDRLDLVDRAKEVHQEQLFDFMDDLYHKRGQKHGVDRDMNRWGDKDWELFHSYRGSWQVEFQRKALAGRGAKPFAAVEIEGHAWLPGMTAKDMLAKINGNGLKAETPVEVQIENPLKKRRGRPPKHATA